jgi:hypothetical protein
VSLAEGVSARVAYKFYTSGAITTNALDDIATAPGATGGQILRRVSSTIALKKATYQSAEVRIDRQIADFRHGVGHVEGNISGELSPETYMDFFEAVHRDTKTASLTLLPATLTSVAFSHSSSTITFAAGNPVTAGLFVGDIINFTGLTTTPANNNVNFTIISFGGTTNETLTVTPAPTVGVADTTFTLTRPGAATIVPRTGHVSRKLAVEVYHEDLDIARLYQENRLGSYKITVPASGMITCEFGVLGRAATSLTSGAAPYFTAPALPPSAPVVASVNGVLLLNGVSVGVITAIDFTMNLNPSQADVVGQNFSAEIFLGRSNLSGQISAFLADTTLFDDFTNESSLQILLTLTSSSAANSPAITFFLPYVKLGSADLNLTGEAQQTISSSFQALLYQGTTPGVPITTVRILDTAA